MTKMCKVILRSLSFVLLCSIAIADGCLATFAASDVTSEPGSANPFDWLHFNPKKFPQGKRLVPEAECSTSKTSMFSHGTPTFPHDPTRSNLIFGRGRDKLPTEIYAKAFDVLQISSKLFQAPAAGESKAITVNGESITIFGTTWYTPLPNKSYVANPVHISPFDATRVFYKDKDVWPSVIYGQPGEEISIAGHKVRIPAAGKIATVVFSSDGKLKSSPSSGGGEKAASESNSSSSTGSPKSSDSSSSGQSNSGSSATANSSSASGSSGSASDGSARGARGVSAEKAAAEKAAAEKAAAEKAATEKAATEKAAAEKAAAEKAAAEKAAAEKAAAEKAAA
ncbi:MAG: hypothetical protein K2X77_32050, partial [Candidatus Obscuribacterales bacterium]|nr:hypothetical protein [Candidatus Obscuribacterales bacterium]